MYAVQEWWCATRQLYASNDVDLLRSEQCSWAPTKRRTVLWRWQVEYSRQHSWDVLVCSKASSHLRCSTVITTQSNTLKQSRLQKHVVHISASILACAQVPLVGSWTQNRSEPQVPGPEIAQCTTPFIGKTYDVIPGLVMSQIHHVMTSPVFHVTSYHNITSQQHKQPCRQLLTWQLASSCTHTKKQLISLKIPCMWHPPPCIWEHPCFQSLLLFYCYKDKYTDTNMVSSIKLYRHNSSCWGMS